MWTALGKTYEYWLDLDLNYCTCNHYYFRTLSSKESCYHLNIAAKKIISGSFDETVFRDDEYDDFVAAIVSDYIFKLRIADQS